MTIWLGRAAAIAIGAALVWLLVVSDDPIAVVFGGSGDMTTESAVVEALSKTPYEISYRKVPRVEGYEIVAGRARSRAGGIVDFSIVLREAGQIDQPPESRRGGSPQFPVVRYSESAGTITGNSNSVDQAQGNYVIERLRYSGLAWVPTREETAMGSRLADAVEDLFAPNLEGGP